MVDILFGSHISKFANFLQKPIKKILFSLYVQRTTPKYAAAVNNGIQFLSMQGV